MNKEITFKIEGDYITDISRQKLLEDGWKSALKILDCIDGLSTDEKFEILRGNKYLSGSNDLSLEDDTRTEGQDYRDSLLKKVSSLFLFNSKQYEPYAVVDSWCDEDFNHGIIFNDLSREVCKKFETKLYDDYELGNKSYADNHPHGRSLHYADNPDEDFAFIVPLQSKSQYKAKVVIFREVQTEVPYFLENLISSSPISAIESLAHQLDRRGARYTYGDEDPDLDLSDILMSKQDFLEKRDLKEQKEFDEQIEDYRKKIIEFADNDKVYGWKVIVDDEGRQLRVPGRAFLHYSLKPIMNPNVNDMFEPYTPVCPMGLKMQCDNPMHTDAWLGAGLSLDCAYDNSWQKTLFDTYAGKYQEDFFGYDFHIITKAGLSEFSGTVCSPNNIDKVEGKKILVLPHLGVEFEHVALKADMIICEQGGKLAHLVTVTKEGDKPIPIIRIDDALIRFVKNTKIHVDLINGKIASAENKADKKPRYK